MTLTLVFLRYAWKQHQDHLLTLQGAHPIATVNLGETKKRINPLIRFRVKQYAAVFLIVLISAAFGSWFYINEMDIEQEHIAATDSSSTSMEELERFMALYPNGKVSEEAEIKLQRLSKYMIKNGSKADVERYISSNPHGIYVRNMKRRLRELEASESK